MATETAPTIEDLTAEVERLRKTTKELIEGKHALKAKIAELEANNATLQTKADDEAKARYEATINVPLKRLATKMAVIPNIFLQEFDKEFNLEIDDKTGALVLMTKDGKVVKGKDDKAVEVSEQGLYHYLTTDKGNAERTKTFSHLLIYRGASGGGAGGQQRSTGVSYQDGPAKQPPKPKAPEIVFGLK